MRVSVSPIEKADAQNDFQRRKSAQLRHLTPRSSGAFWLEYLLY